MSDRKIKEGFSEEVTFDEDLREVRECLSRRNSMSEVCVLWRRHCFSWSWGKVAGDVTS